jgi:glutamyl/glutaminyl-tRNA synthetase
MKKIRTRFAPSPTGRMHVGNLRTALYAYLIAKHEGGDFLLRIEDTDQERFVEGALDLIYKTMKETGLEHDEGPDKDGGYGPYVQSERMKTGMYLEYAKQLVEKGEVPKSVWKDCIKKLRSAARQQRSTISIVCTFPKKK